MKLPDDKYKSTPCPGCGRRKVRPKKRLCSGCESRLRHGTKFSELSKHEYLDNNQPVMNQTAQSITNEEQVLFLRSANQDLENRISKLLKVIGKQQEFVEAVKSAVVAANPLPRHTWKEENGKNPEAIPVIKLSDWHIGEIVNADETEGLGEYNFAIAQRRIFGIVDSFMKWIYTMRHGYRIKKCVVFGEGDYISGDIQQLYLSNEFPVPVQTAKAGLLFGEVVSILSRHFDFVEVHQVGADNHGRMQPKPLVKRKFETSYSYLVNAISEQVLSKHSNVKVIVENGIKHIADVGGWKFLIEHGDSIRGWMGVPYYGIEKSKAKEAVKRLGTDREFDYVSMAHFHVPAFLSGNVFVNGSLSGTSELDEANGRAARPSQVAFMVSPKHGVFNITPFWGE